MDSSPLEGVRVIDLTHALAGPYCTMLLGDLGADVIKVETPGGGDQARHWGPPFVNGESSYFLSVNRNKRSVTLDLKSGSGLAAAQALAAASDVLVENLRPGIAARLGLGYEELTTAHPELVYCSISGFGQDRPDLAGYDQILQGTAGLMSLTGMPDGPPVKVGVPIGDLAAGMFGAHAILAALFERRCGGRGRHIEVSMQDSLLALLTYQAGRYFATGEAPGREGNHHPTIAPYGTFQARDGYLNLAVGSDAQWLRFCEALGASELGADPRFATNQQRQQARAELQAELERHLGRATTAEWQARLEQAGVPAGPILDLGAVLGGEAPAQGNILSLDHPRAGRVRAMGPPWKLDGRPAAPRRPPPLLGEHTAEVLAELNISAPGAVQG